jgi:hypothetical protein
MQTEDTFSDVDGVREDREQGAANSASTETASLTIDSLVGENQQRHLVRPGEGNSSADGGESMPANHETFPFGNNVEPNETWNLDRLAAFVHRRLRRTAKDARLIGKALNLAHKQLTEEREWLRWLQKARVSKSAAYRYCKLSTGYTLEEIQACPRAAVDRLLGKLKADDQAAGGKKEKTTASNNKKHATAETAARKSAGTSSAEENGEENSEGHADREEQQQQPITADECEALRIFVLAVGGWARAEYVLRECRQQAEDVAVE